MGQVFRARHTTLNRDVALKVLPEAFALDPDRLARFRREAQVLASLNHPNIAAIYGFEEVSGTQALVLEFVDGPTLADRIASGPIAVPEALRVRLRRSGSDYPCHRPVGPARVDVRCRGQSSDGNGLLWLHDLHVRHKH
jgi:eukaryotic-like serine/threonine-protein kinase